MVGECGRGDGEGTSESTVIKIAMITKSLYESPPLMLLVYASLGFLCFWFLWGDKWGILGSFIGLFIGLLLLEWKEEEKRWRKQAEDSRLAINERLNKEKEERQRKTEEEAKHLATCQQNLEAAESAYFKRLSELFQLHFDTLRRKRQQLIYFDDYGNELTDKWFGEIGYFIDKVVFPDSAITSLIQERSLMQQSLGREIHDSDFERRFLSSFVDEMIRKSGPPESVEIAGGNDYEAFCAAGLKVSGWNVINKGGSGDQGVDLIAERNGYRVAIQCKFYSSPVGNAAVQEVIAGKTFESATHAAVVSNATFTTAARQLASSAGVLLLHHEQLIDLESLLAKPAA